jgi:hypothetical protein
MQRYGMNAQKSDSRPVSLGNGAMNLEAQNSSGSEGGKSGRCVSKVVILTPGSLLLGTIGGVSSGQSTWGYTPGRKAQINERKEQTL